jgi:hypothetical protein
MYDFLAGKLPVLLLGALCGHNFLYKNSGVSGANNNNQSL